ncbi:MAG: hypothetical protein NTW04_04960 [Elusimicrobia bacterium]|nr:hypothetical protein [Elusimicrobiota bacterium]
MYLARTCPNCVETEKKIHPDVVFAGLQMQAYLRDEPLEKQQHIRIDTIREICNKTQQKAVRDGWKIFIIDQAELLLKEAANALLKFLEEPMGRALWILATSKKEAMLPTIISRCQSVEFCPLSQAAAAKILIGQGVDFAQAQMLAEAGQGSVSRAILVQELSQTLAGLDNKDAMYPFNASKKLSKDLAQARRQAKLFLDMMEVSAHKKWRAKPDKNIFSNAIKKMEMYKKYINQNVSPQLVLQTAIIEFEKLRLTESE